MKKRRRQAATSADPIRKSATPQTPPMIPEHSTWECYAVTGVYFSLARTSHPQMAYRDQSAAQSVYTEETASVRSELTEKVRGNPDSDPRLETLLGVHIGSQGGVIALQIGEGEQSTSATLIGKRFQIHSAAPRHRAAEIEPLLVDLIKASPLTSPKGLR